MLSNACVRSARERKKILLAWKTYNTFKKEGLIKIIEEKDPAVVARNVVIKEKLASAGQKILLVQGFQSDDALNKPSVTVLTI